MRYGPGLAVALALSSVLSAVADAQSSEPAVALVLEVRGATEPALKPYRELRAGDKVTLDKGAALTVLYYDRECRTITIEGGSVTFRRRGEPVVKDGTTSSKEGKCLRRLEARSTAGAIVMRGPAATVALKPAFIIGGTRGADVGKMRVMDDGKVVFETPVNGPRFTWPMAATGLDANRQYVIEFLARDGSGVMASLPVFTAESEDTPALIVID